MKWVTTITLLIVASASTGCDIATCPDPTPDSMQLIALENWTSTFGTQPVDFAGPDAQVSVRTQADGTLTCGVMSDTDVATCWLGRAGELLVGIRSPYPSMLDQSFDEVFFQTLDGGPLLIAPAQVKLVPHYAYGLRCDVTDTTLTVVTDASRARVSHD